MTVSEKEFELGQRVCIIGRGTANLVHRHARIIRITKTMYVAEYVLRGRTIDRRYRITDGREVGASEYGGSSMHAICQRPKAS
jgi:hypothetical protein